TRARLRRSRCDAAKRTAAGAWGYSGSDRGRVNGVRFGRMAAQTRTPGHPGQVSIGPRASPWKARGVHGSPKAPKGPDPATESTTPVACPGTRRALRVPHRPPNVPPGSNSRERQAPLGGTLTSVYDANPGRLLAGSTGTSGLRFVEADGPACLGCVGRPCGRNCATMPPAVSIRGIVPEWRNWQTRGSQESPRAASTYEMRGL